MRMNVYAEELTDETELVMKTVVDDEFGERTFYGVRVYLHSPAQLHHGGDDDDRSAITLWVPWTRAGGYDFSVVRRVIDGLGAELNAAERRELSRHEFICGSEDLECSVCGDGPETDLHRTAAGARIGAAWADA